MCQFLTDDQVRAVVAQLEIAHNALEQIEEAGLGAVSGVATDALDQMEQLTGVFEDILNEPSQP